MAKDKLSAATLKAFSKKPITRIETHADGLGLSIRLTPSKSGTAKAMLWLWRYKAGDRAQTLTLGSYPDLSLAGARQKRDECRAWLAEGLCSRSELAFKGEQALKPFNEYLLGELKQSATVAMYGGKVWQKLNHEKPWSLHDLRRTVATQLNTIGIAPHIVEALLGHTQGKIQRTYNRSQYLLEKLDALNKWQDRLEVMRQGNANVLLWRGRSHG